MGVMARPEWVSVGARFVPTTLPVNPSSTDDPRSARATPGGGETLDTRTVARISAALYIACGGLVAVAVPVLPVTPEAHRLGALGVALVATGIGLVVWHLPWSRWGRRSTLWLVPIAGAVIAAFNLTAVDPLLYPIFFLVVFVWIGLAHPPWTSARFAPLVALAYAAPVLVRPPADPALAFASMLYVLPVGIVIGEAVAWGAARLRQAEADRARSEARFAALVRHASEFVTVLDDGGCIRYVSPAIERLLGRAPVELEGLDGIDVVHPEDAPAVERWFAAAVDGDRVAPATYRVQHADGSWRWIEGTIADLRAEPAVGGIVLNGRDVTERIDAERRLAHSAAHDTLTGLPNRAALSEEMERALARARRSAGSVALLYLDLDGFKVVNDSLGHEVGDRLLVAVAHRLRGLVREGDLLARVGGDELVILVEGATAGADAVPLADRVLDALASPIEVDDRRMVVTASIGIAMAPGGTADGATLLRDADLALYLAKGRGRNRWEVFDDRLAQRAQRRLRVEAELRDALEDEALHLVYQPEVEITTLRVVGAEALLRWNHPRRGQITPGDFVDVAEETGLILPLGRWVIEQACLQAAAWWRESPAAAPRVAVNVSALQLQDERFAAHVHDALSAAGLPGHRLRVELTESILADPVRTTRALHELKALGVQVAIDDFGTGYSSLGYLHRLPVDVVKIDRTFLAAVHAATDRAPLVEATVAMAHSLDLEVVAEGVETLEQAALLERVGCRHAQGYLYGPPGAPESISVSLPVDR